MNHDWDRAQRQLEHGQVLEAIETLATILGHDPEDADAHALLAICLIRRKRLHAARIEADAALALAPEHPFPHIAAAAVATGARRFVDAERHLHEARALDPHSSHIERDLARLYRAWNRLADASSHADAALAQAPDDPDALTLCGELALARGERAKAGEFALRALETDPECLDALVLMGRVELAAGQSSDAREHAAWALQLAPEDPGAIALLCSIKAHENLFLGLWWRFQSWISAGTQTRAIALMIGLYVAYRSTVILLSGEGQDRAATLLSYAWLAFCIYTWVGPGLFRRSITRELQQVRLREDF